MRNRLDEQIRPFLAGHAADEKHGRVKWSDPVTPLDGAGIEKAVESFV